LSLLCLFVASLLSFEAWSTQTTGRVPFTGDDPLTIVSQHVHAPVVLTGGCYEYEAATPYLPFVEAFRRWVREEQSDVKLRKILCDAAIQIAKLAPEIETRLGPFPERPELAPHEKRLLFFDAVVQVFSEIARRQSLLFYADDLHWADRGTLWLLSHLLRQLCNERVLIVGAYRETELDRAHPLAKALVDWNRERSRRGTLRTRSRFGDGTRDTRASPMRSSGVSRHNGRPARQ
jgi:predicted ATPase